jgi:hypothetical protein
MQGWQTYGMQKDFLRHTAFNAVRFFFYFFCPTTVSILGRICVCVCVYIYIHTHMHLTAQRLYMNYRCYQVTLRVKHFYTNREWCEVWTGYLSLRRQPCSNWVNTWQWTKGFTISFSNRKWQQPQLLPNFLPCRTPRGLH